VNGAHLFTMQITICDVKNKRNCGSIRGRPKFTIYMYNHIRIRNANFLAYAAASYRSLLALHIYSFLSSALSLSFSHPFSLSLSLSLSFFHSLRDTHTHTHFLSFFYLLFLTLPHALVHYFSLFTHAPS
jgi:hypothetical protein